MKKLLVAVAFSVLAVFNVGVFCAVASDAEKPAGLVGKATDLKDLVNINTASTEALAAIPGVSPKVAESITSYREANGAFSKIADLINVDGVDMKLLKRITPLLSL